MRKNVCETFYFKTIKIFHRGANNWKDERDSLPDSNPINNHVPTIVEELAKELIPQVLHKNLFTVENFLTKHIIASLFETIIFSSFISTIQ